MKYSIQSLFWSIRVRSKRQHQPILFRCISKVGKETTTKLSSYFSVDNRRHNKDPFPLCFYSITKGSRASLFIPIATPVALSFPYKSYRWILHSSSKQQQQSPRGYFISYRKRIKRMHNRDEKCTTTASLMKIYQVLFSCGK